MRDNASAEKDKNPFLSCIFDSAPLSSLNSISIVEWTSQSISSLSGGQQS
jgi:hypothetical protein